MVDYKFFYKFTVRSLMFFKFKKIQNTYAVPIISKLILFFSLTKIEDVHMVQGYIILIYFDFFLAVRLILRVNNLFLI